MGETTIAIKCTDQRLETIEAPVVASGGFNENKVHFDFCPLWDSFTKTATFYVKKNHVYTAEVDSDDTCIIPHEVTANPGNIFFGVFGVKHDGTTRTSEVIKYKIVQGAITKDAKPSDPTPDIYEQILARLNDITTGGVTVDSVLSETSTNPVQNKIVNAALKDKVGSAALEEHTKNTENPHSVTPSQIGAFPITGGTLEGGIHMNGNTIGGLPDPTSEDSPATKAYVDKQDSLKKIPVATGTTIGGIKVGEFLKVTEDGTLSVVPSYTGGGGETLTEKLHISPSDFVVDPGTYYSKVYYLSKKVESVVSWTCTDDGDAGFSMDLLVSDDGGVYFQGYPFDDYNGDGNDITITYVSAPETVYLVPKTELFPHYSFGNDFANILLNVKSTIVKLKDDDLVVPSPGSYYSDITGGLMLAVGNGGSSVRFDFYGNGSTGKYILYSDGDSSGLYISSNITHISGLFQISYIKVENEGDYASEIKYFALTPLNGATIS